MAKSDNDQKFNAKNKDTVITRTDLVEFIKTQDDFALELYAYSHANDLGYKVSHAGSYVDPVTGKSRQYDVRASRNCGDNFHVYFAIECKALRPSFPLLVSQLPRSKAESYQTVIRSYGITEHPPGHQNMMGPNTYRSEGSESMYPEGAYVGKALVQVGYNDKGSFNANDSEVFDKWGQAIASCNGLIRQASMLNGSSAMPSQSAIVMPVLVVPDETLWTVAYNEDGVLEVTPFQTDQANLFIGNVQTPDGPPSIEYDISHLHIVTRSGLHYLLRRFSSLGEDTDGLSENTPVDKRKPFTQIRS